jgi:hypothetical protein
MAATGFTPISLYYSSTAAAVPTNTNLVNGELAINITDGKLYYKNNSGVVTLLASSAAAATTFSAGTTGFTPSTATSGAVTLAGILNVANGGTGVTNLTAGYIPYGNGSSALNSSANLSYNATSGLTVNGVNQSYNTTLYTVDGALSNYSSTNAVYLNGNRAGWLDLQADGTGNTYIQLFGSTNATPNYIGFYTAVTERMRISAAGLVGVGTASATAMLQTAGSSSVAAFKTPNIVEVATVSATAATGTINYDITTQSVVYYTSNASANWTVNFRGSSGTSMNTLMAVGESMSATFMVTQGSTAYYNSAVQVDGTTSGVTTKWQGSAPTSGNASAIDVYTYVVIKTAASTYTVLASQTKFA